MYVPVVEEGDDDMLWQVACDRQCAMSGLGANEETQTKERIDAAARYCIKKLVRWWYVGQGRKGGLVGALLVLLSNKGSL